MGPLDKLGVKRRSNQRGLTLIEIIIAIAVAAIMFAAVAVSLGSLTGTKAKASAGELGGVIRSLYDTAALTGKTCRLVFQLPPTKDEDAPSKYWAECAAGNITTSRDRDEAIKSDTREQEDARRAGPKQGLTRSGEGEPTLQELLDKEKNRVHAAAQYSSFTAPQIEPRDVPSAVRISIWTKHQKDVVDSGLAYLYFFPQGFTEKAMIFIRQGSNVWTLTVSPLTGKTSVVGEELELPRT